MGSTTVKMGQFFPTLFNSADFLRQRLFSWHLYIENHLYVRTDLYLDIPIKDVKAGTPTFNSRVLATTIVSLNIPEGV